MFGWFRRVLAVSAVILAATGGLVAASSGSAVAGSQDPLGASAAEALLHITAHETRPSVGTRSMESEAVERSNALVAVADLVAARTGTNAGELLGEWSSAGRTRVKVVLAALSHVGDRYEFGAAGPDAFDCSGLSKYAWESVGVVLPHQSRQQIDAVSSRPFGVAIAGDLVWRPGHVMVAVGLGDLVVNAVEPGVPVTVKRWGSIEQIGNPLP